MTFTRWQGGPHPSAPDGVPAGLTLASDENAPARARRAVADFGTRMSVDVYERTTLLMSELVSNSVRHAGSSEVRVEIWFAGASVFVLVCDDGNGFEPTQRPSRATGEPGGLGLPLVDLLADEWGSGRDADSWVWFRVAPRVGPLLSSENGHAPLVLL